VYQITARSSDTVVTITTPTGYTNESAVAGTVWKKLFGITTAEITSITPNYTLINTIITQPSFPITTSTGIAIIGFVTSNRVRTITITYNGTSRNTHVNSPLANVHNDLAGLNGGTANEYYHSTLAEYTGTGNGVFVKQSNATLIAPALGTPTALVGTNITGTATAFTSSNVTTNANLTGVITSVGNATSIASQTGTGTKFVVDTSPTLITPNLGTPSAITLTSGTGLPLTSGVTGTLPIGNGGTNITTYTTGDILYSSATDVLSKLPAGTVNYVLTSGGAGVAPSWAASGSGVSTFSGGTTGLTPSSPTSGAITLAGTLAVANGGTGVTSSTGTVAVVLSNSPTLVTPNLGTPSTLIGTNITGTASGFTAGTVTTNANLTGVITSVGNATSIASQTGIGSKFVVDNSPILTTPNLGTPSTLVGTNITGVATSFTCSNVTTNANLTGVITSVGNATSIASQTGTGTKFVVDTSPILVTPNLGTPTALVGTNISGTASALNIGGTAAIATTTTITSNSTNANNYLAFVNSTSGNLSQLVNSSITCNPSTGKLTGGVSGGTF
jgi:hypothetical protein